MSSTLAGSGSGGGVLVDEHLYLIKQTASPRVAGSRADYAHLPDRAMNSLLVLAAYVFGSTGAFVVVRVREIFGSPLSAAAALSVSLVGLLCCRYIVYNVTLPVDVEDYLADSQGRVCCLCLCLPLFDDAPHTRHIHLNEPHASRCWLSDST